MSSPSAVDSLVETARIERGKKRKGPNGCPCQMPCANLITILRSPTPNRIPYCRLTSKPEQRGGEVSVMVGVCEGSSPIEVAVQAMVAVIVAVEVEVGNELHLSLTPDWQSLFPGLV